MVTLHEVITFLVSMQISISSLQTHNVNRCGRSRHLARKLSLRRKRSSPNVFEMAATETITSIILDRKSGSAGMPRPISYAVFCLKKKRSRQQHVHHGAAHRLCLRHALRNEYSVERKRQQHRRVRLVE